MTDLIELINSKGTICLDAPQITAMCHEEELLTRSFGNKHGALTRSCCVYFARWLRLLFGFAML